MSGENESDKNEIRAAAVAKISKQIMARFKNADKNTKKAAQELAGRAAFLSVTLTELEQDIAENGAIIEAMNGNGFLIKQENPAQKSYNATIKSYNTVLASLDKLAQATGATSEADPLISFITKQI